jgi:hypothetical protein
VTGDRFVKHVVDICVRGTCPLHPQDPRLPSLSHLSSASEYFSPHEAPLSPPDASVYVRYFIPLHPQSTILGEGVLAKNHEMLEAYATCDPSGRTKGLHKAICLWWDMEDADMNSRAR